MFYYYQDRFFKNREFRNLSEEFGFLHNSQLYVRNIRLTFISASQCPLAKDSEERQKRKRSSTFALGASFRSLEDCTAFAGGLRSGQLFMAGCIRGGYKRRLLQTLNSPYINQTPAQCAAPRESEEGDVAPHFLPTHLAKSASSSTRPQRGNSMHSSECYVSARNADESPCKRQRYLPDDICLLICFSIN